MDSLRYAVGSQILRFHDVASACGILFFSFLLGIGALCGTGGTPKHWQRTSLLVVVVGVNGPHEWIVIRPLLSEGETGENPLAQVIKEMGAYGKVGATL